MALLIAMMDAQGWVRLRDEADRRCLLCAARFPDAAGLRFGSEH
jgi:hypothetical protein